MSEEKSLSEKSRATWWGDYSLPLGDSAFWKIGPLSLQILRREKEWQISHLEEEQTRETEETWSFEKNSCKKIEQGQGHRHIFTQTEDNVSLLPRLADRPVVVKTSQPLHIHPGQQADIYVSVPLWLAVCVGVDKQSIQEIPIARPSDTWFGPSTMEGELCYSSTTQGRLFLRDLPTRPHRAISPVLIRNEEKKTLTLEQFSLPTPYLSLFSTDEGGLWTEAITLLNDDETDLAKVTVSENPPEPYKKSPKVSEPRLIADKNMLLRTFSALFR